MLKKFYGISLLALIAGLSSCSDDNPWMGNAGEGAISLKVTPDGRVTDAVPLTRADGLFSIPDAEDFSILLEKTDGSYSKTFETVEDFRNERSFPTGAYTITAFYGRMEDEGFEMPYFHGSESINVLEGRTTEVSINAGVANTLVSIDYTDDFKNYLSNYSATVHTEGHSYQEVAGDKTDPVFLVPGEVAVSLTFTNPQGKTATIQPTSFIADAGHHYHLTLDVNGGNGVGEASLVVSFDKSLQKEDVTIDLSDELFNSPGPKVTPVNFEDGQQIEFLAGEAPNDSYKFTVVTYGGLENVTLTINSANFNPSFGHEINLVGASDDLQNQLKAIGIEAKGVFKIVDRMASIDVSNLPKYLPAGEHEIIVMAKDKFTRTSDPVSLKINCVAPELKVTPLTALFGMNTGSLSVAYNGSHPKDDISFQAMNKYGSYVACPIESVEDATRTRSIETKNYIFNIKLPDTEWDEIPVKVFLYGKEFAEVKLPVEMPVYELQSDAFSNKVKLRIIASENQIASIKENLKFFENGVQINENRINRDNPDGIIVISGLNPNKAYTWVASLRNASNGTSFSFTTENNTPVPNGNFDDIEETINQTINSGGQYKAGSSNTNFVYNTADVRVSVPARSTGWATLNPLTYYVNASPQNTWFMVPSTYMENGAVKVRSVAYSHNGTEPAGASNGFLSANYYNGTAPSFEFRTSGELFLGTYNFTGSESRTDGINFTTRPSSVTFDYSYEPYEGETGEVYVAVLNAANQVISTVTKTISSASNSKMTINLPDYAFGAKAAKLQIRFRSSSGNVSTNVPSGSALNENRDADNSVANAHVSPPAGKGFHVPDNKYKALSTGSILTIDNVTLNY